MGNNCVGLRNTSDEIFSLSCYWSWSYPIYQTQISVSPNTNASQTIQQSPPHVHKIDNKDMKSLQPRATGKSACLREESILLSNNGDFKEYYELGDELGEGGFGTTSLCLEKSTGKTYACKVIPKVKLLEDTDVEDVRREIKIMHHLVGIPNVICIKGVYEDSDVVYIVMELCEGGELFDRIKKRGYYTEPKAAKLARTIVSVVEACHSRGVMHRDLKPENFLFVDGDEDSTLKIIDFGLSIFFKPGMETIPFSNLYQSLTIFFKPTIGVMIIYSLCD